MATITKIKLGEHTHSLGGSSEIIDITTLETISQMELLDNCRLRDGHYIYHLVYKEGEEYYFENCDEHVYRYIGVTSTGDIDRWEAVPLATQAEMVSAINNKIQCAVNDDGSIDLFIN